jgi:hypothetical protein
MLKKIKTKLRQKLNNFANFLKADDVHSEMIGVGCFVSILRITFLVIFAIIILVLIFKS